MPVIQTVFVDEAHCALCLQKRTQTLEPSWLAFICWDKNEKVPAVEDHHRLWADTYMLQHSRAKTCCNKQNKPHDFCTLAIYLELPLIFNK